MDKLISLDLPDGDYIARDPVLKSIRYFRIIKGEIHEGLTDLDVHDICKSATVGLHMENITTEGTKYDA